MVAAAPLMSFAQGALTIFSEDGDRFYLVLNGVKQNPVPQTNVRIDGLTSQFYSAKILFEDAGKPEITKNIPVTDPGTNDFADVTYKIKRNNKGELKIRYFGATPIPVSYNPPPDMYYMHYGQPAPAAIGGSTTVTQTTYTTTNDAAPANATFSVNAGGAGVSMSVGAGDAGAGVSMSVGGGRGAGVNMNVNVNDGSLNSRSTTTTTTTTRVTSSSISYGNDYGTPPPPPPPATRGCGYPMAPGDFSSALQTIKGSSFDDTKLSTAKTIVSSNNCVSTDQVIAICKLFSFEDNKVEFAKYAYDFTTDRKNYFKVANIFTFDSNKTELNDFISGR